MVAQPEEWWAAFMGEAAAAFIAERPRIHPGGVDVSGFSVAQRQRLDTELRDNCPICLEALTGAASLVLECGGHHVFHAACLGRHVASLEARNRPPACPSCRSACGFTLRQHQFVEAAMQAEAVVLTNDAAHAADQSRAAAWEAQSPLPAIQPQPVPRRQLNMGVTGEWNAIDPFTALECVLSPCGHLIDVPSALRPAWARANAQIFEYIEVARRDGDTRALDRGLKWQLCIHDVLLRGPSRTSRGSGTAIQHVACRFDAWRAGERMRLLEWWQQDRQRALRRSGSRHTRRCASAEVLAAEEQQRISSRALTLIQEGELARAVHVLDSNGVAEATEGVLRQLRAKHPARHGVVPATLTGTFPSMPSLDMRETIRGLPKKAGTGVSGFRNEYMCAWLGSFDDVVADSVIAGFNTFTNSLVRAQLPAWYYHAIAMAKLSPIVKSALSTEEIRMGVDPDVRPVAVGDCVLRAVTRKVAAADAETFASILAPQQLGVGIKGGISILIHGIRLMMEQRGDFVVVKLDMKNGFNAVRRSTLLRRMAEQRQLGHLMPFLHAVLADPSELYVKMEALFAGERYGSEEGTPQGFPLSSAAFALAIHAELCALDTELRPFTGGARAIMDDVYAMGPASAVFPALLRFATRLKEATGLELQSAKSSCWSAQYDLRTCPWRLAFNCPIGTRTERGMYPTYGIMVGGIPLGDEAFIRAVLHEKVDAIVVTAGKAIEALSSSPHSLWSVLYYSLSTQFDFWLRHVPPAFTRPAAARMDELILNVAARLGYDGMLMDDISLARLRLPARMRGCGLRSRVCLAPIAFTACFVECAERMLDLPSAPPQARGDGYFQMLVPTFGATAFGDGGQGSRLAQFLNGSSPTAVYFSQAWEDIRMPDQSLGGLLNVQAAQAGSGRPLGESLQRLLTSQAEQVARDALHTRIMGLPRNDTRRLAWLSSDEFSSQWVSSWPRGRAHDKATLSLDGFGGLEFGEVFATYLGRESPAVRNAVRRILTARNDGQPVCVPDAHASRAGRQPECDLFGFALGSATLPGGGVTSCHDGCADALFNIMEEAGLRMEREPTMFTSLIPSGGLMGPQPPQAIRPDAFVDTALPAANPMRRSGGRRPKPGAEGASARHLIDVKTIYGGTQRYLAARATMDQCGAVDTRAECVNTDYRLHARKIDNYTFRCPACPQPRSADRCVACSTQTPVADALATHGAVRGAVFGQYGEASIDVHSLVRVAARECARRKWRGMGARSQNEAYAFFVAANRRALGVSVVREFARHRLRRLGFIGVPIALMREVRDEAHIPWQPRSSLSPEEADFFRFLQGGGMFAGA